MRSSSLLVVVSFLALGACNPSTRACVPGASVACTGPGGCAGGQVCAADGSGYGACVCGGGDAGLDGSIAPDGGSDAGRLDSGRADVGTADVGTADVGTADVGTADVGTADGSTDAAMDDAGICGIGVTTSMPTCDACLNAHCCTEFTACWVDSTCQGCATGTVPPTVCATNAPTAAFRSCVATNCTAECPGIGI